MEWKGPYLTGSTRAEQSAAQQREERRLWIHPRATIGLWSLTGLNKSSKATTSLHLYEKFRPIAKLSCRHLCLHVSLNKEAWKIKTNAWVPLQPNYTGISSFMVQSKHQQFLRHSHHFLTFWLRSSVKRPNWFLCGMNLRTLSKKKLIFKI